MKSTAISTISRIVRPCLTSVESYFCLLAVFSILGIFLAGSSYADEPAEEYFSIEKKFDFGPQGSDVKENFIPLDHTSLYADSKGFGLLSGVQKSYDKTPDGLLTDKLPYDGISDEREIKFRADVDPGDYWIEIYMEGGMANSWRGTIKLNGELAADTLRAYASSFEGDDPPPYWTLIRKVRIDDHACIIEIDASNQPTTLSGLLIYRAAPGKIQLIDGRLYMTGNFKYPNAGFTLRLLNEDKITEAQRLIDPMPEELLAFEKASLLIALAGRPDVRNPRAYLEWAATILKRISDTSDLPAARMNLRMIELYLEADQWYKMAGWDWAAYVTRKGIFNRLDMAGFSFEKLSAFAGHPLSDQSTFQLGKLAFWGYVEQHGKHKLKVAQKCFDRLLPLYPDNQLLKMYAGERIPAKEITYDPSSGIPEWSFWASQALKNIKETIHYWVDSRQADNGEFGGKYDDDVEMLRWWPIARMAMDDQKTLLGLKRLVDGIWNSHWITEGFSTKLRDVEHSSEPVADTQPMMIGLDYGNPIYVERCMQSIRRLNDLWTGVNQKGHRHFRSSWYSYNEIDERPPRDCDVPMNTRTIKALRWLAWYNHHPVAIQFLREWGDAWLEDCLRTDKGKPSGVVPAAIRYADDAIGGHADNWHHPGMFWGYFNFHGGADMLMQFLATYDLTSDDKYLKPIELAIELVRKYEGQDLSQAEQGSEGWTAAILKRSGEVAEVFEQWRLITGKMDYDAMLAEHGSDYLKYRLSGDRQHIIKGNKHVLEGIVMNNELLTTEGYFTDRIEIGNMHLNRVWGSSHLESVYTGSSLSEGFYPFHSVTWKGFADDFAAIVNESSDHHLVILAVNLGEHDKQGRLFFWRLSPGEYRFKQGEDPDQDGKMDEEKKSEILSIQGRGSSHEITLPTREPQLIELIKIEDSAEHISKPYPDLAITKSDIVIMESGDQDVILKVPVHNIGTKAAQEFDVEVTLVNGTQKKVIGKQHIPELAAPLDLEPKLVILEFLVQSPSNPELRLRIELDSDKRVQEITELNNTVTFQMEEFRH